MKCYPQLLVPFSLLIFVFCNGTLSAQCSGTPNAGTASAVSSTLCVTATGSATLSAAGLTTGTGITYQWQVSAGGSFTNVSGGGGGGGTSASFTTAPFPIGTYSYQVRTTCAFSTLSITSNIVVVSINQSPTVSAVGTLTPGNTASIVTAGGTGPFTYTWSPAISTTSIATALSAGVHSVVVKDNGNCGDTVFFNVSNPVNLWGITPFGGTSNYGVIYNCNPPLNTFTKTLDFVTLANGLQGNSLMQASNGKFYGMCGYGGTYSLGVLFVYDPILLTYTKLLDFNGASNGASPVGGLIQANNGKLYGMATEGGANNKGVLFEYNPTTNTYSKKLDFGTTNGETPRGDLLQGSNGKFYGLTYSGGASGYGTLFEYDLALNTYSVKVNFSLFTSIGGGPLGSLIQATNGKLYGTTSYGGSGSGSGSGTLIEYDFANNTCLAKVSFTGTNGDSGNGSLVQANNNKIYGFTTQGGIYGDGVLFEYDPANNTYVKKIEFNKPNTLGNMPINLTKGSNGNLYGLTYGGVNYLATLNNQGTLFEYNVAASMLFKKIDFTGSSNGGVPVRIIETLTPCSYSLTSSAGNSAICAGSSVTITVSGITNYSWSTGATTNSIVVSPTLSTSYAVTGSAPACLTPSAAGVAMVTVNPLPALTTNSVFICPGNTATVSATGANSYSWSTGASASTITVSPVASTIYTVTGFSSQACLKSETVSVMVFTSPNVVVNSATICAGQTATLIVTGLDTYTWSTLSTNSVVALTPSNTTIYTVSGSICSIPASNTTQVWVNSLPTVAITNANICSNQIASLIPSGASSYSVNGVANSSFTFNPVITTTYAISGSSNNCTSANIAIATVSVNTAPTITVSNITICSGQTATLNPLGALSFSVNGSAISTFTFNPINSTNLAFVGSDNICVSNSIVATVSVNATPSVSLSSAIICAGQTATLIPSGASSYSVNGSAISTFTFNPSNTSTYAVIGASNSCLSNSVITTVSVNARPIVSVNNVTICSGKIVTLTPSGASVYSVNALGNTTFTFNAVNAVYAITGSSNNCVSSNTAYATINVINSPTVSVSNVSICAGQTASLTPNGASSYSVNGLANSSFTFNPASTSTFAVSGFSNTCASINTAIATVSVNQLPIISVSSSVICSGQTAVLVPTGAYAYTVSGGQWQVTPSITSNYSISGADQNGCVSANTAVASISVNPSPSIAVSNSIICSGQSAVLVPTGANIYSVSGGQWTVSPNTTTNYSITGIGQNGCVSGNTAVATVSVNTSPTISANNGTICATQIFTLSLSGANSYSINGSASNVFTFSPLNTTSYVVTGQTNACSSNSLVINIHVNNLPLVSANNASICVGQSVSIVPSGAITYTISGGSFTVSPSTTTVYALSGTDSNGCSSASVALVNVVVNALPNLSTQNPRICAGEAVVLTVNGANTYTWSPGIYSQSLTVVPGTTSVYTVTGADTNNCENSSTATVTVDLCTDLMPTTKSNSEFAVFPNPNTGEFTIACEKGTEIFITDVLGQIVYRQLSSERQTKISLLNFDKGVYFVKVSQMKKKIIIE